MSSVRYFLVAPVPASPVPASPVPASIVDDAGSIVEDVPASPVASVEDAPANLSGGISTLVSPGFSTITGSATVEDDVDAGTTDSATVVDDVDAGATDIDAGVDVELDTSAAAEPLPDNIFCPASIALINSL